MQVCRWSGWPAWLMRSEVVTSARPHVLRSEIRSRIQQSSASSEGGVDVAWRMVVSGIVG